MKINILHFEVATLNDYVRLQGFCNRTLKKQHFSNVLLYMKMNILHFKVAIISYISSLWNFLLLLLFS